MLMDPRCKRLNELNDYYHVLFRDLAEKYLTEICAEEKYEEPLCMGDYLLLNTVSESSDGTSHMAEISKKLNINPSTATRRVNRLQTNGLVSKSAAPGDDRRYDLRLTDCGRELISKMDKRIYEAVCFVYQAVSDDEKDHVYHFLEKCIDQLKKLQQ